MAELLIGLAPPRRRRLWLAALASVALAGAVGVAAIERGPGNVCGGAEDEIAAHWNPHRAATIAGAFRASGRPDAAAVSAQVARMIDRYARSWIAMRTEACMASRLRGEQPEALLRLRLACLDARLSALGYLTRQLSRPNAELLGGAVGAAQALGTLGVCADEGMLLAPTQPDVAARPGALAVLDGSHPAYLLLEPDGQIRLSRHDTSGKSWRTTEVTTDLAGSPAVAAANGSLVMLMRKRDGTLWSGWSGPGASGWRFSRATDQVTDDPAFVVAGQEIVYFVRRADGWLWRGRQGRAGVSDRSVRVMDGVTGRPSAAFDTSGELFYFTRRADASLWYGREAVDEAGSVVQVKLIEGVAGDPVAIRDGVDKLTYFVRRGDGTLIAGYQHAAGDPTWHAVKITDGVAGNPAISFDGEGKLTCLMRKSTGSLWWSWQHEIAGGEWHELTLAESVDGDPSLLLGSDRRLTYIVRKSDGSLWRGDQQEPVSQRWTTAPW